MTGGRISLWTRETMAYMENYSYGREMKLGWEDVSAADEDRQQRC